MTPKSMRMRGSTRDAQHRLVKLHTAQGSRKNKLVIYSKRMVLASSLLGNPLTLRSRCGRKRPLHFQELGSGV